MPHDPAPPGVTALPTEPPQPPPRLLPSALPPGGVIGVCAPSGPTDPERLAEGLAALERAGYQLALGAGLLHRDGYLAGDDAARAADLQALLADPGVHAVVCARGGYGAMRILPLLDLRAACRDPKPLVGYSDITALHLAMAAAGLVSFHGAMVESGRDLVAAANRAAMLRAITDPRPLGTLVVPEGAPAPRGWVSGMAHGRLVGGNLSLLAATLGTPWEVDTEGAILLLEDTQEPPYRLDRYLTQLALAGKLQAARGFVVGALKGCDGPEGQSGEDVCRRLLQPWGRPCAGGWCLGHGPHKLTVPLGADVELDVGEAGAQLRFPLPALRA